MQKEKALEILGVNLDEEPALKQMKEVFHLQKQIGLLPVRFEKRDKTTEKALEGGGKIRRDRETDSEGDSTQGYREASPIRRGKVHKKFRGNPFTKEILDNPLPSHFKPVNYEYHDASDPEDHIAKFENVALLHQYSEGVKCRVFSTTRVGATQ